jgi:membrane-associated protease RseP (regulator of RpoE activity)
VSQTATDSNRVLFERLPAGEYRLSVYEPGGMPEMMTVRVPEESTVRFEPDPVNCLDVSVDDASGELAAAGFLDGDRIIGMDGTEFENMMQMQTLLMAAMGKEEVRFLVQRGGGTLEIGMSPKKMMEHGKLGGELEPGTR